MTDSTPTDGAPTDSARTMLESVLREIVPDASLEGVAGGADLRAAFELDSLDVVELVERLGTRAGIRIEDDDAHELLTIDSATAFLDRRSRAVGP